MARKKEQAQKKKGCEGTYGLRWKNGVRITRKGDEETGLMGSTYLSCNYQPISVGITSNHIICWDIWYDNRS